MRNDRIGDIFILGIILTVIILKITGIITLSRFWLFSPLIFLFGLGIIIAIILILMCLISIYINKRR